MINLKILGISALLCLCSLFACSPRFADHSSEEIKVVDGYFKPYKYFNTLYFKSHFRMTSDTEVYVPISYTVNLPKDIVTCFIGLDNFSIIIYDKKQFVFLIQDYENVIQTNQGCIEPSENELEDLINHNFPHSTRKDFGLVKLKKLKGRKTAIVKKQEMLFVFYNVLGKNFNSYLELLNSFTKVR